MTEMSKTVPLVYYDDEGNRHIIGTARIEMDNRYIDVSGCITDDSIKLEGIGLTSISLGRKGLIIREEKDAKLRNKGPRLRNFSAKLRNPRADSRGQEEGR